MPLNIFSCAVIQIHYHKEDFTKKKSTQYHAIFLLAAYSWPKVHIKFVSLLKGNLLHENQEDLNQPAHPSNLITVFIFWSCGI